MTDGGATKVQESQRSPAKPEAAQPVFVGTEREPQGAAWVPYARGGVAAPPIVPPHVLRTVDAPRGMATPRADYVRHLQRLHGNQATIRHLKSASFPLPAKAEGEARRAERPTPLGPARVQRPPDQTAVNSNGTIRRESWFEEGAMYLFEQGLAAAGVPVEAVMGLLRRAGAALSKIIDDPGAFLTHLLDALKGGFRQFASNIGKHLQAGLIGWLTGTLGGAGIQLPKQFDLAGIFDLALQILGLTADRIKAKVGQVIGAKNVRRIEAVWKVVSKLISGGLGGLWDMAKDYVGNLYDMVIGQVKEWAITQIVQQAVIKIISMFNPAGALVQVVQTIWNIIQFLRERGAQLFAVFQRIAETVSEIAEGNIGNAVNAVERTLASAIAPLLGLLARLIGLGDIAERIKQIIDAIRAPIDKALDRVIAVIAKGLKGAIGALGKLVGLGGTPGAEEASAETKAAQERREQQGVEAGVRAFDRFSGRPVGEKVLRPLLTAIRLRYRLAVLEPVVQGDKWAVHGEIRRTTVVTGVPAGGPTGGYPTGEDPRGRTITQLWQDCSSAVTLPGETPEQMVQRRQMAETELIRRIGNQHAGRIQAILGAEGGQAPRSFVSIASEDGLGLGGHTQARHVFGSPTMPDVAALAHRVCRNRLINGANAPCPGKAGAFSGLADADTAVTNGLRQVRENWPDIRQRLAQGQAVPLTATLTARGIAVTGGVVPPAAMPPYFGGSGTRPLYPGDPQMQAHSANPALTQFVDCTEVYIRIVPNAAAPGGWYINSAWPQ